jgi:hypothetical protein
MSVVLPGQLGLAHGPRTRRKPRVVRLTRTTLRVCAAYYAGGAFGLTVTFPPAGISAELA